MIPRLFESRTDTAIRTALTGLQTRQQTIAYNIANVDTPGYKAKEVHFEEHLGKALRGEPIVRREPTRMALATTHGRHIQPPRPAATTVQSQLIETAESTDGTLRNDGNTVDVDREMPRLAETQISYGALGQIHTNRVGVLRTAVTEGRR
ncbi:MAG: flagellar basal body rod protein FlgB [Chloroflexi bacterium]|nr:flagellar basal body rod protein FlgB [Chloroflexota bacterium]